MMRSEQTMTVRRGVESGEGVRPVADDEGQPAGNYREDPASLVVSYKLKVSKWQEASVLHLLW